MIVCYSSVMFLHSPSLIHQPFEYSFTFAVLSFVPNGSTLLAMAYFYYSGRVVAPELFVFAKNNVCYVYIHCQNDKKFAFSAIAFSILSLAISKYLSSNSIPMNPLLVFTQATPVVPLPIVLSKTTSPSFV